MCSHVCYIVPPYLLQGIAESKQHDVNEDTRVAAKQSLDQRREYTAKRSERFAALAQPRATRKHLDLYQHQSIVPEILLKHIAESQDVDQETRERARHDCDHIHKVTAAYKEGLSGESEASAQQSLAGKGKPKTKPPPTTNGFYRAVYDAKHTTNESKLPGTVLRVEGQAPAKDEPANQAFDNAGKVLDFYQKIFNWKSIDNKNMHVLSSVHFAKNYENAFWDPEKMQMVYGDGYTFLYHFTNCIDVIGHELTVGLR
jgi:Zn-dependent metalloprotease